MTLAHCGMAKQCPNHRAFPLCLFPSLSRVHHRQPCLPGQRSYLSCSQLAASCVYAQLQELRLRVGYKSKSTAIVAFVSWQASLRYLPESFVGCNLPRETSFDRLGNSYETEANPRCTTNETHGDNLWWTKRRRSRQHEMSLGRSSIVAFLSTLLHLHRRSVQ